MEKNKAAKKKNKIIDYNNLNEFLTYRQIKYSSFDLLQIKNMLVKYFRNLDSLQYCNEQNWLLIQKYVSIHSNPFIFDLVVKHRMSFQGNFGDSIVCDYLLYNYQRKIDGRKPKQVDKMAKRYPYNYVPEAIMAIERHRSNKRIHSLIKMH